MNVDACRGECAAFGSDREQLRKKYLKFLREANSDSQRSFWAKRLDRLEENL